MLPAATRKGGLCFAAPDVCKTPPLAVPVPYPNMASPSSATATADKVLIENKATVCEDSVLPSSTLDEAGSMTGVKSGTVMGPVTFKTYSSKVFAQGKKIVYHTAVTAHNGRNGNIVGCHVTASQAKVIIAV